MNKNKIVLIVSCVVLMGISFYAGNKYGQGQAQPATQDATPQRNFGGGQRGGRNGGGFNMGEILSKDKESITLKLRDGGSKIVFYTDKTSVMKTVEGTLADLVAGKQVSVMGTPNADGSVNAQSVQIRTAPPSVVK